MIILTKFYYTLGTYNYLSNILVSTIAGTVYISGNLDGTGTNVKFGAAVVGSCIDITSNYIYLVDQTNIAIRQLNILTAATTTLNFSKFNNKLFLWFYFYPMFFL